jgi:hypothetical protein
MSTTKLSSTFLIFTGAFLLYCGDKAMDSVLPDGGDLVSDANAHEGGECCSAPLPSRTRLAAATITGIGSPIDVSSYREVIVQGDPTSNCSGLTLAFSDKADDTTAVTILFNQEGGTSRVLGNYVRVANRFSGDCNSEPYGVTIEERQ